MVRQRWRPKRAVTGRPLMNAVFCLTRDALTSQHHSRELVRDLGQLEILDHGPGRLPGDHY